jgi:hypothetical protein
MIVRERVKDSNEYHKPYFLKSSLFENVTNLSHAIPYLMTRFSSFLTKISFHRFIRTARRPKLVK